MNSIRPYSSVSARPTATAMLISCGLFLGSILFSCTAAAQQECGLALGRADRSYDAGNLREVITLLTPCVDDGLSTDEKWQAYRLLALAHIFLDDSAETDIAIRNMLEANPRYQVNPSRDPIEFIQMLATYRVYPQIAVGFKAGADYAIRTVNSTFSLVGKNDYVVNANATYGSEFGVSFDWNAGRPITLVSELLYSTKSYHYTIPRIADLAFDYQEDLNYVMVPLTVRMQFLRTSFSPYLRLGGFARFLLNAASSSVITSASVIDTVNRDLMALRNGINVGVIGGAGLSYTMNDGMLVLDARYEHSLSGSVKRDQQFPDQEQLFTYPYIDDFTLHGIAITIGYVRYFGATVYRH